MGRMPQQGKSTEAVEDIAGRLAESGYGLAYDDSKGLIKKTRTGPNPYDAARTFGESDVSISHSSTTVRNGSLALVNAATASVNTSNSVYDTTSFGLYFVDQRNSGEVTFTLQSGTNFDGSVHLDNITTATNDVVTSKSAVAGDTITFTHNFTQGDEYRIRCPDADGTTLSAGIRPTDAPDDIGGVTLKGAYRNGSKTTGMTNIGLTDVKFDAYATSGSATISWSYPNDVYEWDVATFTRTLANETADVYIAYNDGSGWTRTNSGNPVTRNYDLSADSNISPGDRVRFEVELSRTNTSNDPSLDSAFRSWVV